MKDIIIVGRGPAGLSAALYTVRAGMDTLVIGNGSGAVAAAAKIDNYYGFAATVSGAELSENAYKQVERLGGRFVSAEALDIRPAEGGYAVACDDGAEYEARAVIIATGKPRSLPPVKNLAAYEGAGVSHCAVCDGFFYRGKDVGVLGEGRFALAEARELAGLARTTIIYTNGHKPAFPAEELGGILLDERKITSVSGEGRVETLHFADGGEAKIDGLFIAHGTAGGNSFSAKLGIVTEKSAIAADRSGRTNVPGIFAAGDCTGAPFQISVSVGEGAAAGLAAAEYVREQKRRT